MVSGPGSRRRMERTARPGPKPGDRTPHGGDGPAVLGAGRSVAAWFPQTAPHLCRLAVLGENTVNAVRAGYAGGEFGEAKAAARLLPGSFVWRMALAGDAEEAAGRVGDVLASGVDLVGVFPLGAGRVAAVGAFAGVMPIVDQPAGSGR
jgi:5,10-methylenetetrahydromethanopterin reductase